MTASRCVQAHGHKVDAVGFRGALIAWGKAHFRPFPWRLTSDPYLILTAEAMLHRTQARQVVPVYERFVRQYPEVSALAQATKEELHQVLHSLGLKWRIDLIWAMACDLMNRFGGQVPESKEELLTLPGVNEYIASATCCFAWNRPEALIDTNTVRVAGRLFGLEIRDSSRRNRRFRELLGALVDTNEPRAYNYAVLDLADQVCMKKRQPDCPVCPVVKHCTSGDCLLRQVPTSEIGEPDE